MAKYRILHIVPALYSGGVGSFLLNYYKRFDKDLFQFDFVTHYDEGEWFSNDPLMEGSKVFYFKQAHEVGTFRYINQFKSVVKGGNYDIVQYATPNAALYASLGAKWAGVKKRLYCQWGIRYVGFSGFQRKLFKAIEKIICNNSTHIRPASWKNLEFAVEEGLYKREKAAAIGDGGTIGIDMKQFDISLKPTNKKLVLEQYPQLKNKIVFCFVGRLNRDKGVFELLEAFQRLCTERNDVALLQIGDMEGELPPHLEAVRQNKNVVLTGWTNEVPKYISASDILVHPSYREGFSMVIQQAMAMEIPVVTTDIPGPSEVIEPNVSGLLAKARDVETLYNCMKWMLEHPEEREQMGKAGRKRCEEKFNRERMLRLTLEDRENILKE